MPLQNNFDNVFQLLFFTTKATGPEATMCFFRRQCPYGTAYKLVAELSGYHRLEDFREAAERYYGSHERESRHFPEPQLGTFSAARKAQRYGWK